MSTEEPQVLRDLRAAAELVEGSGYQPTVRYLSPSEAATLDEAGLTARDREAILADRLARVTARAERAEAQVERVRGLAGEFDQAAREIGPLDDGAADAFPVAARNIRAALAETETGHQTRSEAPRSAEEPVSRVPGPDGVLEAGRRAGAIVDSEGAW